MGAVNKKYLQNLSLKQMAGYTFVEKRPLLLLLHYLKILTIFIALRFRSKEFGRKKSVSPTNLHRFSSKLYRGRQSCTCASGKYVNIEIRLKSMVEA